MPWEKLSVSTFAPGGAESITTTASFNNLPYLIAGPILRRVEKSTVSVWLAFKVTANVTLNVYDHHYDPQQKSSSLKFSGTSSTTKLGENLHLIVVTASTGDTTKYLNAEEKYYYDVEISISGVTEGLGGPGILSQTGNINLICFDNEILPSFVLPASSNINKLSIFHGSCRKPHGNRTDALASLGKRIKETLADNMADIRPQQLFLTGDQIYADDVSDLLLFQIIDASKALMGWQENLSLIPHDNTHSKEPGKRHDLIYDSSLTVDKEVRGSHLMALGEFFSMYLFIWSEVLWQDSFPLKSEVPFLTQKKYNQQVSILQDFKLALPEVRRVLANIPTYMIVDDHEITDDVFLNLEWCQKVLGDSNLPLNTPPIPGNPLGKRIIQNGLTAFAVFQAWGNTPAEFVSSKPGGALLNSLTTLNDQKGVGSSFWQNISAIILPSLTLGLNGKKSLTGGLEYWFTINFDKHQVIVLDTRTRREFPPEIGFPDKESKLARSRRKSAALISEVSLAQQLTGQLAGRRSTALVTIVVSPSPVIGHSFVEETGQPALIGLADAGRFITLYKKLGKGRLKPIGREAWDLEGWAFEENIFQVLLQSLSIFGKVVVLSGDVHYAFSNKVDYWDRRITPVKKATIVQMVSSSLKNETGGTNFIATSLTTLPKNKLLRFNSFAGWMQSGSHVKLKFTYWDNVSNSNVSDHVFFQVKGFPNVFEIHNPQNNPDNVIVVNAPDWRYRLKFFKDIRNEFDRGVNSLADLTYQLQANQSALEEAGKKHNQARIKFQKIVVGRNNIGEISFDFSTPGQEKITQALWYDAATKDIDPNTIDLDNIIDHTIHEIPFNTPDLPYSTNDESHWKNFAEGFPS